MMLFMSTVTTKRPGTELVRVGLFLVVIGVVLAIATMAAGGNATLGWISVLGLLMAAIGFAQRILAALEK